MKVGVIVGSTRPSRIGLQLSKWVSDTICKSTKSLDLEIIDLAHWNLPMFNEPEMPSKANYLHPKTVEWSEKIQSKDGFIFVTPQYNWGYPAAVKNAIDYLYVEWNSKPAIVVCYGYKGGSKGGHQLCQVLLGVRMVVADAMPAITISHAMFNEDGSFINIDDSLKMYNKAILDAIEIFETVN